MRGRSNVSPVPLPIDRTDEGIAIEYLDGRSVQYGTPVDAPDPPVESTTSFEIHVLVVDADRDEGIMVYINDYDTVDEILEATGVGRILLGDGDSEAVYPGVRVSREGERIAIAVEEGLADAWVYVFVENPVDERAYRLAHPAGADPDHCK